MGVLEELSVIKAGPNDMDTRVIDIEAMRRDASEAEQALAAALLAQGIRTDHAIQACQAVFSKPAAQDMTAQLLFREALDWLCLHLPAEALPAAFRREGDAKGMTLTRNTPEFTPEQLATASDKDLAQAWHQQKERTRIVQSLANYGFAAKRCKETAVECDFQKADALLLLAQELLEGVFEAEDLDEAEESLQASDEDVLEAQEDEAMALEAIFPDDFEVTQSLLSLTPTLILTSIGFGGDSTE